MGTWSWVLHGAGQDRGTDVRVSGGENWVEIPSLARVHACKEQTVSHRVCFRETKLCSMTEILQEAGGGQEADSMQRRSHDSMGKYTSTQGHQERAGAEVTAQAA